MFIETLDREKISKATQRWSGVNETDLRSVGNDSERLVDVVARKGGLDREQARREVEDFLENCGCSSSSGGQASQSRGNRPEGAQASGGRPATSNDDQTGEMASAGPGRKTRPEDDDEAYRE